MSNYQSKRLDKFYHRLKKFAIKYPSMRDAIRRVTEHYNEPDMLVPDQNVIAMKWVLEDNAPTGLAHAIQLLFKKNGEALTNDSLLDHLSLFKAIVWLSENIENHTATLRGLIEANEWEKIGNGMGR